VVFEVDANARATVGIGAALYDDHGNDHSNGFGDLDSMALPSGHTSVSRIVEFPKILAAGRYELVAEVWPANKVGAEGFNTLADSPCGYVTVT